MRYSIGALTGRIGVVLWLGMVACQAVAGEISREAPAIYEEKLRAMLTPLDVILAAAPVHDEGDADGAVLMDEEIHYIDETGRRYLVDHRVYKALKDSSLKDIAEEIHSHRKSNQKIHLVSAQTIGPDGKKMPVQSGGMFLQTPQRNADNSIYDDREELRLIFPNVKVGSVTESIVVIEESQFRIPGEYTAEFDWAMGWPGREIRRVVELPAKMADRLRLTALGAGVPGVKKSAVEGDRVRLTWERRGIGAMPQESNVPPVDQTGPVLWLSTLPDWEAFMHWYEPLAAVRSTLNEGLAKEVDDWTKDAHGESEILAILMRKVADEVRYTGLEFGSADLQPHDCNEVWTSQYGDCKDKANLLCAMLRHKKIKATMALINTEYVGRVEKRSPDYRYFDHAIVAVEPASGGMIFCDPTIRFANPGLLSPGDEGRDVLLVQGGPVRWERTPAAEAGEQNYDLDLKLGADGELSGWLIYQSNGYYGVWDKDYYSLLSREDLRSKARQIVRGFFSGAELMDAGVDTQGKEEGICRLKMYFVVPGTVQDQDGKRSLLFPQSSALFVNPGEVKDRQTTFHLWPDIAKVHARIHLPDGFSPSALPRPYQLESPSAGMKAGWTFSQSVCLATLEIHNKQSLISAQEFGVFFNSMLSLHAWLDNPLSLSATTGAQPAPEKTVDLEDFPILSSGDSQLDLVAQRFPNTGDSSLRKEALLKVMQYFPTDKTTLFNAGVQLALIDWQEDRPQQAADAIQRQLEIYRGSLAIEDAAWGDYMLSLALKDAGHPEEALKILQRVGSQGGVTPRRRAWCAYKIAQILQDKSVPEAIASLRAGFALESDAKPQLFTLLAQLLLAHGQLEELRKEINQLTTQQPAELSEILTALAEAAPDFLPAAKQDDVTMLLKQLGETGQAIELGKSFSDALQSAGQKLRERGAVVLIRSRLLTYLKAHPPAALSAADLKLKTKADFLAAGEEAVKQSDPERSMRLKLELLTRLCSDTEFPEYLWKLASAADWKERFQGKDEPLLRVSLDLCDLLPVGTDSFYEGKFIREQVAVRKNDLAGAQKVLESLIADSLLSPDYRITALDRLSGVYENQHEYSQALKVYRQMEAEIRYDTAKDGLLRAVFLNLEMNHRPEALRLLALLGTKDAKAIQQAATGTQIAELVELGRDSKKAEAAWEAAARWWPDWLALEASLGFKSQAGEVIIPAIPSLKDLGAEIGNAIRSKDQETAANDYRKAAHAARWQPGMVMELLEMLTFYPPTADPGQADACRKFVVKLCENFASDDSGRVLAAQYYGAINALDAGLNDKTLEFIHRYEKGTPPDNTMTHGMSRLWAMAAFRQKTDFEPAMAALEKSLASPNLTERRAATVLFLADIYRKQGRPADEERLLEAEAVNPAIKQDADELKAITTRLDDLAGKSSASAQMTAAVERWLAGSKPAWFDFAEPKTLDDPRLGNLEAVLADPGQVFSSPEVVKLQMLAAASTSRSAEQRQAAFVSALETLLHLAATEEEAESLTRSIIEDDHYPQSLRVEALGMSIFNARNERRMAYFEKLASHPLAASFNDGMKQSISLLREALQTDASSPEKLAAFCTKILGSEVSYTGLQEFRKAFDNLLRLQAFDAARKILPSLDTTRFASGLGTTPLAFRLDMTRRLNSFNQWAPVSLATRALVLAQFPEDKIQEPQDFAPVRDPAHLHCHTMEEALRIQLYQVKTRQFDSTNWDFWLDFSRNIPRTPATQDLLFAIIETLLKNAPTEQDRALAVRMGIFLVDGDDAAVWSRWKQMLRPWRDPVKYPDAYACIRFFEIHHAIRSGEKLNVENEFATLGTAIPPYFTGSIRLGTAVLSGDPAQIKKTLNSMSVDQLLSRYFLAHSLRAFAEAGMTDELAIAKDSARKLVYQTILSSWTSLDTDDFEAALALADALDEPSLLPQAWLDLAGQKIRHSFYRSRVLSEQAYAVKDWEGLVKLTDDAILQFPTFYRYYWLKGSALYHLGRKKEAVEPLTIYTRYSKDEVESKQADAWLKEIHP